MDSNLIKGLKTTKNGFSAYSKILNNEEIENLRKISEDKINKCFDDILNGNISMGHARVLSKLEDTEKILDLTTRVKNEKLSVRELEEIASNPNYKRKNPNIIRVKVPNQYGYVEDALTDKIGNRVRIKRLLFHLIQKRI